MSEQVSQSNWITRRRLGWLLITAGLISAAAVARLVDPTRSVSVTEAQQFIRGSGDRLIGILDGPGDPDAKRRQLQALINETMDVLGIARFVLGRFWSVASEAQRSEYVGIFPQVLLTKIDQSFGSYRGVRFSIDRATQVDGEVQVSTTLFRPDYTMQVTWVLAPVAGAFKIVDVVANGTSMRITQRHDCVDFLSRNNGSIRALLDTLRHAIGLTS